MAENRCEMGYLIPREAACPRCGSERGEPCTEAVNRDRALFWAAAYELNSINAATGAPHGVSQDYWDRLIDAMRQSLGGDIKPWPEPEMKPYLKNLN